jgi:chromosome segregation ATPase
LLLFQAKSTLCTRLQTENQSIQYSLQQLEEEKRTLDSQRKDLQVQVDELLSSLTAKEENFQNLQNTFDEKEKTLRGQLQQTTTISKKKVQDLSLQNDALKAELVQTQASLESLRQQLSTLTKERTDVKELQERTQSKLDFEVQQNQVSIYECS